MNWADENHPLWKTIRFVVMIVFLTVILATQAQHFDHTEISAILMFAAAGAGFEVIPAIVKKAVGALKGEQNNA